MYIFFSSDRVLWCRHIVYKFVEIMVWFAIYADQLLDTECLYRRCLCVNDLSIYCEVSCDTCDRCFLRTIIGKIKSRHPNEHLVVYQLAKNTKLDMFTMLKRRRPNKITRELCRLFHRYKLTEATLAVMRAKHTHQPTDRSARTIEALEYNMSEKCGVVSGMYGGKYIGGLQMMHSSYITPYEIGRFEILCSDKRGFDNIHSYTDRIQKFFTKQLSVNFIHRSKPTYRTKYKW